MPIYEYRCTDCGHRLEALQRLADQPLLVCPACGKESLTKLMSAVGFQLKGSGWYATDFKHSGSKPAEKGAKSEAANEGAGSAEKGEGAAATASAADNKTDPKTAATPPSSESKTTSTETKSSTTTPPAKPAATGS
ncbi:MAG: zinc ribbon domain-containing protein [Betaproteobacteria bacterium]|nr:MAG: zinc ribbon domain-containing protein [Betaproteobacteria bacterium]